MPVDLPVRRSPRTRSSSSWSQCFSNRFDTLPSNPSGLYRMHPPSIAAFLGLPGHAHIHINLLCSAFVLLTRTLNQTALSTLLSRPLLILNDTCIG